MTAIATLLVMIATSPQAPGVPTSRGSGTTAGIGAPAPIAGTPATATVTPDTLAAREPEGDVVVELVDFTFTIPVGTTGTHGHRPHALHRMMGFPAPPFPIIHELKWEAPHASASTNSIRMLSSSRTGVCAEGGPI